MADDRHKHSVLLLDVMNFIGWHDPDDVQGGVTAEKAFDSFCQLLNLPAGKMMNVVRGKPEIEEPHRG